MQIFTSTRTLALEKRLANCCFYVYTNGLLASKMAYNGRLRVLASTKTWAFLTSTRLDMQYAPCTRSRRVQQEFVCSSRSIRARVRSLPLLFPRGSSLFIRRTTAAPPTFLVFSIAPSSLIPSYGPLSSLDALKLLFTGGYLSTYMCSLPNAPAPLLCFRVYLR